MAHVTKTPPRVDVSAWRGLIPADALAEAERLGPDDRDTHTETAQEAAERRWAAMEARTTRWRDLLPPLFAQATLGDFPAEQQETLLAWMADQARGVTLILAGPVGTGKTHAAYALGNALIAQGIPVEAVTLSDLLNALRPDGDAVLAKIVRTVPVLILDDLGATKASEWAQEQVVALLDARLKAGLRQIVTTNATYADLEAVWDHRATDRLRFRSTVVTMTGESRRVSW